MADSGGKRSIWFFAPDSRLELPLPEFTTEAELVDGSILVTVIAQSLLVDFCLFADRLADEMGLPGNALKVDEMFVSILPGEHTIPHLPS